MDRPASMLRQPVAEPGSCLADFLFTGVPLCVSGLLLAAVHAQHRLDETRDRTTALVWAFGVFLRLWPGVVAVVLLWLARLAFPIVFPEIAFYGVLAGIFGGLVVFLWWLFFSRAPWSERVGAIVLMPVALFATSRIVHESIATGMMGMMLPVFAIPILSLALVCWAVASRRLSSRSRRASMVAAILLACGVFALLRTGGITGDADADFHWRSQTPEERLLARAGDEPTTRSAHPAGVKTTPTGPRSVSRPGLVDRAVGGG
jgi:hypothetical protein